MGNTKTDLVRDLEAKPDSPLRGELIVRARTGYYHDFESKVPAPKVQLAIDLQSAGFEDLVEKVVTGGYDDEAPSTEQVEQMREDLGSKTYEALFGKGS